MSFGSRLKKIRLEHEISQEEMATLLSMQQSTYSKYETDKIVPNLEILQRVAEKFNVDIVWLLKEDGTVVNIETIHIDNGNNLVNVENYYNVPKDFIDTLSKHVETANEHIHLMQKLVDNLVVRLESSEKK